VDYCFRYCRYFGKSKIKRRCDKNVPGRKRKNKERGNIKVTCSHRGDLNVCYMTVVIGFKFCRSILLNFSKLWRVSSCSCAVSVSEEIGASSFVVDANKE